MRDGRRVRNRLGLLCTIVGTLLLAGALALLVYNRIESQIGLGQAAAALEQVATRATSPATPPIDSRNGGTDTATALLPNPYNPTMTEVEIDGVAYVGYLSIPSAGVELPVTADWDYDLLRTAACRYAGSIKTDDLVIAVHNYLTGYLGVFASAPEGETVYFVDMDGRRHTYTIAATEVLMPDDVEGMLSGGCDLTVFSCTYGGSNRVAIRCVRAE